MSIALCIIVKPDKKEAALLKNCLKSVYRYVDKIYITITGKCQEVEKVARKYNAEISYFDWKNNFAEVRNFNFSQAKEDYVLWLDSDDTLRNAELLKKAIELLDKEGADVGILDYEYDHDEFGNITVEHKKARIVKNDGCVKWVGKLHEDLIPQRQTKNYYIAEIKVVHNSPPERKENAKKRNLEIALLQYKENPNDPKNTWDLANAYASLNLLKEAILFYLKFVQETGSEEERFLAWHRLANSFCDLKDYDRALECEWEALKIRPNYPDPHLGIGEIYYRMGKPQYAKEWLIQGLTKPIPEFTAIVYNPRDYDYNPLRILARVYFELNKPKEAKICLQKCLEIYPNRKDIKREIEILDSEIRKLEKIDEIYEKALKAKTKEEIKKLIDEAPLDYQMHPKLIHLKNTHFVKEKSSGRDLVIYCYQTEEKFDPDIILKEGRGGSEEAVYHISKRLADLGWNVEVYANCGHKERKFRKVVWKPWWSFNPKDKQDILIVWRHPAIFEIPEINAVKKYVWLHDILEEKEFTKRRLDNINKIIALSKWQRDLFPNIPNEKFLISSNGVDLKMIEQAEKKGIKRDLNRLIYTSSYDRGLETLLKLFPQIRHKFPKAELHIFYGWNLWDIMHLGNPEMMAKKKRILNLLKQPGVYEHGRISQEKILEEYLKANILAYPTEFGEINFLSGIKAQALGCIPITTKAGCLDETIQFGLKVDTKNIYSDKNAQREWIEGVIKLLENPPTEKDREEMKKWAREKFDWDKVALQFHKEFIK